MAYHATVIRHLATSWAGNVLAAGEFERLVHLYDLSGLKRLRTIETTLDFGGNRLAVSADGQIVVAGAYLAHGIAAYSVATGAELWRRKDLKNVQHVRFERDDSRVLCTFDAGPCESLNARTGESGRSFRGVRNAWESPYAAVRLLERSRSRDYTIADPEGPTATISRESFAALSVAFSRSHVCLSESGGPVRALDLSVGKEVWRHVPPSGTHFLRVAFSEDSATFVGVSWPFERGGAMLLQRFSPDGKATVLADLGRAGEIEFSSRGGRVVTACGAIYDVGTGRQTGELQFPRAGPTGIAT